MGGLLQQHYSDAFAGQRGDVFRTFTTTTSRNLHRSKVIFADVEDATFRSRSRTATTRISMINARSSFAELQGVGAPAPATPAVLSYDGGTDLSRYFPLNIAQDASPALWGPPGILLPARKMKLPILDNKPKAVGDLKLRAYVESAKGNDPLYIADGEKNGALDLGGAHTEWDWYHQQEEFAEAIKQFLGEQSHSSSAAGRAASGSASGGVASKTGAPEGPLQPGAMGMRAYIVDAWQEKQRGPGSAGGETKDTPKPFQLTALPDGKSALPKLQGSNLDLQKLADIVDSPPVGD